MRKTSLLTWLWGIAAITAAVLTLKGINLPYVGLYNANNNYLALASRNFLRFGYRALNFLPTYYVGASLPTEVPYYLHHPTLFFLAASVPFRLFGDANWVVHAMTLLSTVAWVWVYYVLVSETFGRRVARWAAVLALLFPLTSFFWKYIFFEQPSMVFTMLVLLFSVRYWKTGNSRHLFPLFCAAAIGGATDWYGGYMVFGYAALFVLGERRRMGKPVMSYIAGEITGLATYLLMLAWTNNLSAVWDGFSARGISQELIGVSYWPIKYFAVTLIRIVLYASPFALAGVWVWWRGRRGRVPMPQKRVMITLLSVGLVNLIVLPTASWGHSYFLFYLVPFLALVTGVWIARLTKGPVIWVIAVVLLQLSESVAVGQLKYRQAVKQGWKYAFGRDVARAVPRYSRIGAIQYAGDVMQNYFGINVIPMTSEAYIAWEAGRADPEIRYVMVACADTCTESDAGLVRRAGQRFTVREYRYGSERAWLLDRGGPPTEPDTAAPSAEPHAPPVAEGKPPWYVVWYRIVRNAFGSPQL